ncbi:zinc ribbon domain-containing protein, partial [Nocardioides sp.]|uniref:zinc ribbon domain-containing protein n=1 Tax=Nocardioides sp. TaxID=35761 RepID=UPI00286A40A2
VRCARCGGSMVAGQYSENHQPKYRCKTARESGPLGCAGGHVLVRLVEAHVLEHVEALAEQVETVNERLGPLTAHRTTLKAEEDALARQVVRTDEALTRLAVQDAEHPLPPAVYTKARQELVDRAADLERSLADVQRESRRAVPHAGQAAVELLAGWERWPVTVRREALRGLVHCVLVSAGTPARFRIVEPSEIRPGL